MRNEYFMTDLRSQIPARQFCLAIHSFPPFPSTLYFFQRWRKRISQTAIESRKISTELQSGERGSIHDYIFSQKRCFLFHLFQVEWKTNIVNFFENCSINSTSFYELWSRRLISIKFMALSDVVAQFILHFFGRKRVTWKTE